MILVVTQAIVIRFIIFFLAFFLLLTASVSAQTPGANFTLESITNSLPKNEIFMVQIFVNAPQPINTVRLLITYPSQKLMLKDVSFNYSNFPNIVERNVGTEGAVDLTAFTADPFQGSHGLVATLKFNALGNGEVLISLQPDSKIHLSDGLGTNVFNYQGSEKFFSFLIVGEPSKLASPVADAKQTLPEEKIFFPETNVVDLTKTPVLLIQKIYNQFQMMIFIPFVAFSMVILLIGVLWYIKR